VNKTISTINLTAPCIMHLYEKKKSACEGKFETILLEAVDEVFSSFGHICKQALYFQLEKTFKIKKHEIPTKIPEFAAAIEQLFGAGAKFIELRIIATLHQKTPNFIYSPPMADLLFVDYVASLRRFFLITNSKNNTRLRVQRKQNSLQFSYSNPYFIAS